jgi:hypothetical protein
MRAMRRLMMILLILLVPLQSAWSTGHALYGHSDDKVASTGPYVHAHDHDHDDDHRDRASAATPMDTDAPGHGDNKHHGCHFHPVFTVIPTDRSVPLSDDSPALPPSSRPASFTSHSPPLFDRPPSVRA